MRQHAARGGDDEACGAEAGSPRPPDAEAGPPRPPDAAEADALAVLRAAAERDASLHVRRAAVRALGLTSPEPPSPLAAASRATLLGRSSSGAPAARRPRAPRHALPRPTPRAWRRTAPRPPQRRPNLLRRRRLVRG